jgi:hypothetical protein
VQTDLAKTSLKFPERICSSNDQCSFGEICNPTSQRCYSASNLYSGLINEGGKCNSDLRCKSGICQNFGTYSACAPEY